MNFTEHLRKTVDPIWQKNHTHPFVKGIGDGTLPLEKYRYYMCQDYVYLIEYSKLFAIGCIKSNTLETMAKFAWVLSGTLNGEMDMHRKNAGQIGIPVIELERTKLAPTALSYVSYMLKIAHEGTLVELTAALLPCMWSYMELGKALKGSPGGSSHKIYGDWINMYNSEEFFELTGWLIDLMDILAEGKNDYELNKLEDIFITSSKWEHLFWEMAFNQETWPL